MFVIYFSIFCLTFQIIRVVNLVEANGVKSQAQVKKSNGNTIQNAKENDSLHVDGLVLKKIQSLRGMERAECDH